MNTTIQHVQKNSARAYQIIIIIFNFNNELIENGTTALYKLLHEIIKADNETNTSSHSLE